MFSFLIKNISYILLQLDNSENRYYSTIFHFSNVFLHGFLKYAKNQEMTPVIEKPMNIPKMGKGF